jgi:hypothetical protein
MLGDPSVRVVDVYVPAGHDGEGLPLLVDLVGFTGSGLFHTNWVGSRENLPERLDRLIGEQCMPPIVVAFPQNSNSGVKDSPGPADCARATFFALLSRISMG